jgi:hypothetical protein
LYTLICSWAGSFAQFDIGDRNEIGKGDGVITKEEFSRVMDGWETCRRGVCKCQFDCRNRRDTIFSLASGVDEDLDKKITWNEFLRAVEAKRLTEKSVVMAQVRYGFSLLFCLCNTIARLKSKQIYWSE